MLTVHTPSGSCRPHTTTPTAVKDAELIAQRAGWAVISFEHHAVIFHLDPDCATVAPYGDPEAIRALGLGVPAAA